jgi:hypothetical protein
MAFVRKVSPGNEHDVYVTHRKKCFQLFCLLMEAVGVPDHKLKESSHYFSLLCTLVMRFIMVPFCSKRLVERVLRSEIRLNC